MAVEYLYTIFCDDNASSDIFEIPRRKTLLSVYKYKIKTSIAKQ